MPGGCICVGGTHNDLMMAMNDDDDDGVQVRVWIWVKTIMEEPAGRPHLHHKLAPTL